MSLMLQRFMMAVSLLTLVSCAHAPVHKQGSPKAVESQVGGIVLDQSLLSQGGDLALGPFKPGDQAEANDETDRISSMILKGIKDYFDSQHTSLHVVDATQTHPKFVLEGYIHEFSKAGKMSRMMMRPNKDVLRIEGEIWLIPSGQRLAGFSANKKFDPKKEKPFDVAYALGHDIAEFIVSHTK
jgi:hypothetical protein